jgi:hypothetical protein
MKGIIHCHSTYSYDAKLTLKELRDFAVSSGIQFICMTEHVDEMTKESAEAFVRECEALSDDTFRFIPGFEVPYRSVENGTHSHVLMIGARSFFGNYAPTIEELRPWTTSASFVVLAHPVRNQFLVDDGLLSEIHALEVWNQQYEGKRVPRTRSLRLFAYLRKMKPELRMTGGVDFHRREHMGGPFVTLPISTLSEDAILEALRQGTYRITSPQASFPGNAEDIDVLIQKHRLESLVSVVIIVLGKTANKIAKLLGLSFPRRLTEFVRKKL